ncbi:MAG: hypothetical protein Q7Q71_16655 [Verrucomicrobiota bacterium JB023]|nr:hypothetical protein [Verrucomicrobiota bacterium JB023]
MKPSLNAKRSARMHPCLSLLKNLSAHLSIVVVALIAAEVLCMVAILPFMQMDRGMVVVMGLVALPLWAALLTLVYTADRRWRTVLVLLGLSLLGALILFFTS